MTWQIDPTHSAVGFRTKHMMVATVKGTFDDFEADVTVDPTDPTKSEAEFRIATASINTGTADRDAHLKSGDFFNAGEYPNIIFRTKQIKPNGSKDTYEIEGDLTIRNVTKPVTFEGEIGGPVEDPWGGKRLVLSAETTVNRKDWGLDWNMPLASGGFLVSEKVTLSIDAELTEAA